MALKFFTALIPNELNEDITTKDSQQLVTLRIPEDFAISENRRYWRLELRLPALNLYAQIEIDLGSKKILLYISIPFLKANRWAFYIFATRAEKATFYE